MNMHHQEETFTLHRSYPVRRARRALAALVGLSAGLALGCVPGHGVLTDTLPTTSEGMSSTGDPTGESTGDPTGDPTGGSSGGSVTSTTSTTTGDTTTGIGSAGDTTSTATGSSTSGSTGGSTTEDASTTESSTGSSGTDSGTTSGGLEEGECRDDGDCDEQLREFCFAPGEVNCGVCETAEVLCSDEEPCDEGSFCDAVVLLCPCDEPIRYECRANCGNDDECGPDRICDGGECAFLSCNDGFVCPETHDCLEGGGEGNDCNRRPCVVDGDCAAGDQVCVKGRCFLDFGVCEAPAP